MSSNTANIPETVDGQYWELSKRVDATHDLVRDLDTRFESHRLHMDDRLDKIVGGMGAIVATQARQEGIETGVTTVTTIADRKAARKLRRRSNAIGVASVVSVILSTAATFFAAMHV